MPSGLLNTVAEREVYDGIFLGSMVSLMIEIPTEAGKVGRTRKQRGSAGWRNMFVSHGGRCFKHRSVKKTCKLECRTKS